MSDTKAVGHLRTLSEHWKRFTPDEMLDNEGNIEGYAVQRVRNRTDFARLDIYEPVCGDISGSERAMAIALTPEMARIVGWLHEADIENVREVNLGTVMPYCPDERTLRQCVRDIVEKLQKASAQDEAEKKEPAAPSPKPKKKAAITKATGKGA